MHFRRRFSSAISFISDINEASMTPNLARHLQKLALLIPCSRHSSETGTPPSACFNTAMIWASLYGPFFIVHLLRYLAEKILLLNTANFRGITASTLRVFAQVCEDHALCAEVSPETIELYRSARHAKGNVSTSIASWLKELRIFALLSDLDEQVIAKLLRLQKRYDRAAKRERKRKDVWAAKSGKVLGDVWVMAVKLLTLSKAAPGGSALQAGLALDAACLALSVFCPLRCGDLHRIVVGSELSRHAQGWSLQIVTRKGERTYHRPELWPELTPFLDAVIMLDMTESDLWEAYERKRGMALFSRDGGVSTPGTSWPTCCWHRHFGIEAHIIRSLWHSLMFESENDDQWIALALCDQGNGRTTRHYILEGGKKTIIPPGAGKDPGVAPKARHQLRPKRKRKRSILFSCSSSP